MWRILFGVMLGISTALTSSTRSGCYCDVISIQPSGGSLGGRAVNRSGNALLLGIATGLFKSVPIVTSAVKALNSPKSCKNLPQWDFVRGGSLLPGHACGLPTVPTLAYLLHVFWQLMDVECSLPRDCHSLGCDPYHSVFTYKRFCRPELRTPNLTKWQSDEAFVGQFLYGGNPMEIQKVKSMTEIHQDIRHLKMYDGGVMLSPEILFLDQKLFLVDYSFLDSIHLHSDFVFYSPQVLLYLNDEGSLELFAILLHTNKGPRSHIMTKFSQPNKFLFAKMHVALADSQSHQFIHHLATHFCMESVAIARNNYLRNHLLGKLLEPHLRGTIFINWFGRFSLLRENQTLADKLFSVGQKGALKLLSIKMNFKNWNFPNIMTEKGFPENESDGLQNFFYRSDGFQLWNILQRYVSTIVYRAYSSDTDVLQDNQLQQFACSLANKNFGNIQGFPNWITSRESLVEIFTSIIFTSSVQHQALNAPQHSYSYAPHRPTLLRKWMPNHDRDITWGWIKEALPTIIEAKAVYGLFNMLVKPSLCTLSKLDMVMPGYEDVLRELKRELSKLSSEVKKRKHEYDYLDPDKIACSIDI